MHQMAEQIGAGGQTGNNTHLMTKVDIQRMLLTATGVLSHYIYHITAIKLQILYYDICITDIELQIA